MSIDPNWLTETFPNLRDFRRLSRGGQKWVYKVIDKNTDNSIVLKIYFPGSNPERALREVRAARVLDHPRVPDNIEIQTASSQLGKVIWVLEDFIPGSSLSNVLKSRPATDEELYTWTFQLLEILTEAAERNIVHRDIKPGNIIIDTGGDAWLLDFGLARHVDLESITATEAKRGVGTPGYSPPEQFLNIKGEMKGQTFLV